jgi:hypothetical protein
MSNIKSKYHKKYILVRKEYLKGAFIFNYSSTKFKNVTYYLLTPLTRFLKTNTSRSMKRKYFKIKLFL